jgi:hypothetical protein
MQITRRTVLTWLLLLTVALMMCASPAAAQRRATLSWWDRAEEVKIGSYWFKSDIDPDLANDLALHMNRMYEEYARRLASLPARSPEKLNVLMFATQQDYLLTLRSRYGIDGTGSGGMFFVGPQGSGLAFWIEGLPRRRIEHVMQHEGFHQFAYSRFGNDLPIWVNEGLAEFFGNSIMVNRNLIIGQTNPRVISHLKDAIERKTYIPLVDMLSMSGQQWNQQVKVGSAGLQYEQAWSMVHFLAYADNGRYRKAFEGYLRLLNQGVTSYNAFVQAFGTGDVTAFEQRWVEYASDAKPSSFFTAMERAEFLAEGLLELGRRKMLPDSMDDLKEKLREIDFEYTILAHGHELILTAEDDDLFVIPQDDLARKQPLFELTEARLRGMSRKQRKLEDANPTPPTLATTNLAPRNLRIVWTREEATNTFRYEIVVK